MNRTLQDIKALTSLNNLKKGRPLGQVATLLILIITAVLIFVLIVANIGQVSNYATNLSNASDAASLYLASQLGTKSYQLSASLYNSCGSPTRCCTKTGLLSTILAIIVAIIAIVITIYCAPAGVALWSWVAGAGAPYVIGAGMLGGAVGGGIGGAIAGTGWVQGAIQGATIGAAIGAGVVGGASIGAGYAGSGGATVQYGLGSLGSEAFQSIPAFGSIPATASVVSGSTLAAVGAMAGATLAVSANIYSAYAKDQMLGDAMAAAVKALNGLPEEKRIRESVFLQALSSTIDDPNKVIDDVDSDGDGNTTERVPNFQVCWDKRITWIKEGCKGNIGAATNEVNWFLRSANGPVNKFQQAIGGCAAYDEYGNCITRSGILPHLSREEVEGCTAYDEYGNCIGESDGTVTLLLRALENAGYDVSFWIPGPTGAELAAWKASWDPTACPGGCEPPNPPAGYDELDFTIDELGDFNAEISELRGESNDDLVYNWRSWVPWFYEPEPDEGEGASGDYYSSLYRLVNGDSTGTPPRIGLKGWINEIENIRRSLPDCTYGCGQFDEYGNLLACYPSAGTCRDCILNPPCKGYPSNPNFGTIDEYLDDEFQAANSAINEFIPRVEEFRQACVAFYNKMVELMEGIEKDIPPMACGLSGINPVIYTWTDSRGEHNIQVKLSKYQMPRLVRKKYGNWLKGKKCIELIYYQQDVKVTIDREDPANVLMGGQGQTRGVLGSWNPYYGGSIQRRSKAQYRGLKSWDDKNHPAGWVKVIDTK